MARNFSSNDAAEWVEGCYVTNFAKTPTDGSAVLTGDGGRRVVRGSWRSKSSDFRVVAEIN